MLKKFFLFLTLCMMPIAASAASIEELEKRVSDLEQEISTSQEINEIVNSLVKVSGYADIEYVMKNLKYGSDTEHNGFRMHHLSLFFQKEISEKLKFFAEIELEDGVLFEFKDASDSGNAITHNSSTDGGGKIFVEAVNADYMFMPQLSLRLGRFFTPAGIWSVDHYPPFVATQDRPQFIRNIFPQITDGAMVFGTQGFGNTFLNYNLYYANGSGNNGSKDSNSEKAMGLKASVLVPLLQYLEVGGTYYADTENDNDNLNASGVHLKMREHGFTLQTEYASGLWDPKSSDSYLKTGYYAQLLYDWKNWTVGYRYDLYEDNTSSISLEKGKIINSYIANYHISHEAVVKLEHHQKSYEDKRHDFETTTIVSLVLSLGN